MGSSLARATSHDELMALTLLEEALAILDGVDAPGEIGAHIDLAICRLRDRLEADTVKK